jgi:hypothetical protein
MDEVRSSVWACTPLAYLNSTTAVSFKLQLRNTYAWEGTSGVSNVTEIKWGVLPQGTHKPEPDDSFIEIPPTQLLEDALTQGTHGPEIVISSGDYYSLTTTTVYNIYVWACDLLQNCAMKRSYPFMVDITPPAPQHHPFTGVVDVDHRGSHSADGTSSYAIEKGQLRPGWPPHLDNESGIYSSSWELYKSLDADSTRVLVYSSPLDMQGRQHSPPYAVPLELGRRYVVQAKYLNGAGGAAVMTSAPFIADWSRPAVRTPIIEAIDETQQVLSPRATQPAGSSELPDFRDFSWVGTGVRQIVIDLPNTTCMVRGRPAPIPPGGGGSLLRCIPRVPSSCIRGGP